MSALPDAKGEAARTAPEADRAHPLLSLLFFTGFALLACHEIDAVTHKEWRLLPLLSLLRDDAAYVVFVASHVPLIGGLMWLVAHPNGRLRRRSRLGIDVFLILHALLHWASSGKALYTFHSPLSEGLIFGGGAVGLAHLLLLARRLRAAPR